VIAGHEPCGVVAAVGTAVTDKEARIGKRVMDHHYDGCGNCKHCRAGWTQMCLEGPVVYGSGGHGGHAKYMKVPVSTLVPLPDSLSFVTGAAISCGTGTAWGALRRVELQGGETSRTRATQARPAVRRRRGDRPHRARHGRGDSRADARRGRSSAKGEQWCCWIGRSQIIFGSAERSRSCHRRDAVR